MSARLLDGKMVARELLDRLRPRIVAFKRQRGRAPALAIVSIGLDHASHLYARKKLEACRRVDISAQLCTPSGKLSEPAVLRWLDRLAKNPRVDAILIESPLPKPLDFNTLVRRLPAAKDVEGLSDANFGRLFSAKNWEEIKNAKMLVPATAQAVLALILKSRIGLRGANAVVVGRSSIIGRPVAHLLSACDATVTLCHSRTRDLRRHLRQADIVVSAVGRPGFIHGRDLKRGAVVVDVGINYRAEKICGDVDFKSAERIAAWITPVPGGVGPVTTAYLLSNAVLCAEKRYAR